MARGKKGIDNLNEQKPVENPEIKDELLNTNNNQDNEDNPGLNENNELNNLSNEQKEENVEEPGKIDFTSGDKVKVKKGVNTDTMGRRIHAGLQNYTYTIRSIRPDGIACIECLTHVFNMKLSDLEYAK